MSDLSNPAVRKLLAELGALRGRVAGVTGCVIAGADGLVVLEEESGGFDVFNVAALAATAAGVGRQVGLAIQRGEFMDCTIHNTSGYFTVFGINEYALLAVQGDANLNVALLHLETRSVLPRIAGLLDEAGLAPRDQLESLSFMGRS